MKQAQFETCLLKEPLISSLVGNALNRFLITCVVIVSSDLSRSYIYS